MRSILGFFFKQKKKKYSQNDLFWKSNTISQIVI